MTWDMTLRKNAKKLDPIQARVLSEVMREGQIVVSQTRLDVRYSTLQELVELGLINVQEFKSDRHNGEVFFKQEF